MSHHRVARDTIIDHLIHIFSHPDAEVEAADLVEALSLILGRDTSLEHKKMGFALLREMAKDDPPEACFGGEEK